MKTCMTVFRHELQKILQDKKLLAAMIVMPLMIVFMTTFLTRPVTETPSSGTPRIYALGNALEALETEGFEIVPAEEESIEELTGSGKLRDGDAALQLKDGAAVIYYNEADTGSSALAETCRQLLRSRALAEYAAVHGVPFEGLTAEEDLSPRKDGRSAIISFLLPYMLVLLLFQSSSSYAIDTIAGEKERGVFSTLLLTPHRPGSLICGKLLACTLFGIFSCVTYMLILVLSAVITGVDSYGLMSARVSSGTLAMLALCALLLSNLFATVAVMISLHARTEKEARTLQLPVYGLTLVLSVLAMFRAGTLSALHYAIPVYNISVLIQDLLSSGADAGHALITLISLAVCTALLFAVTVLCFRREEIRC